MIQLKPASDLRVRKAKAGRVPLLILSPKEPVENAPGILWIHGGGYVTGMKEMAYFSRAAGLVRKFGCVVAAPDYRLALLHPYPAAIEDCYQALLYLKEHAAALGVRSDQLMVGGESAGGGLCAALCMLARDRGGPAVAFQMPLYPMLDNFDTESSRNNHGKVWNTRRNHFGWRMYLRGNRLRTVSPYAAAARQTDYTGLPPAYTFVGDGEPFYCETLAYIENLQKAGIPAEVDVYPSDMHAFDLLKPDWETSRRAAARFEERFDHARTTCFAAQK